MARNYGPKFKKCRSLGLNVYNHEKAMNRFTESSSRESKIKSAYGLQLLEKQRLKEYYGVLEKQFRRYVSSSFKSKNNTGAELVISLETRLDNIVYRSGFASSLRNARQLVTHGHINVNNKKVDRPSFKVLIGDEISLKKDNDNLKKIYNENLDITYPYIEKDSNFKSKLIKLPLREEVPIIIKDHLVVEYYSKLM